MIKRNYLFLAVETGLSPAEVLKQTKPSIIRVCGVLGDSNLKPIYDFDIKVNLQALDEFNIHVLKQYTTYKESDFWSSTSYENVSSTLADTIINKSLKDGYELLLCGHNYKNWIFPILYNFLGHSNKEIYNEDYIIGSILRKSQYNYVCTMELGNVYNMLYNQNVELNLDAMYNTFIGKEVDKENLIDYTLTKGAMEKTYQSLSIFRFFKENIK